jgi:hypothetical protein
MTLLLAAPSLTTRSRGTSPLLWLLFPPIDSIVDCCTGRPELQPPLALGRLLLLTAEPERRAAAAAAAAATGPVSDNCDDDDDDGGEELLILFDVDKKHTGLGYNILLNSFPVVRRFHRTSTTTHPPFAALSLGSAALASSVAADADPRPTRPG